MNAKETILQVAVAALAVIGFYGILHGLIEAILTPRELAVAVVLNRPLPPEELDILLCEARRTPCGRGKRVVLVLSPTLWETCMQDESAYADMIEKYAVWVALSCEAPPPRQ